MTWGSAISDENEHVIMLCKPYSYKVRKQLQFYQKGVTSCGYIPTTF